jgi:cAMP-dependent protein kinase regulator
MAFWRRENKGSQSQDPQALVARREYTKAIGEYRNLLASEPDNYIHHHKIADVYCLAGRQADALDDYAKAADGYARDGFMIKAIAILKKMQKIDPENPDVAARLDELSVKGSSIVGGRAPAPVAGPAGEAEMGGPEIALDMEAIDEPPAAEAPPPPGAPVPGSDLASTPLFSDMTPEELREVLVRLKHHSFGPEAVILKEGDPGDSMFVIGQGRVSVTATGPKGRPVELAQLGEGDFFGEVCLLTGKPRTATITSLDEIELLELTREDLKDLESRHPRVREVIKDFYEKRVASTVETMLDQLHAP